MEIYLKKDQEMKQQYNHFVLLIHKLYQTESTQPRKYKMQFTIK